MQIVDPLQQFLQILDCITQYGRPVHLWRPIPSPPIASQAAGYICTRLRVSRERERKRSNFRKTLNLIRQMEGTLNPLQMAAVHGRMWRPCGEREREREKELAHFFIFCLRENLTYPFSKYGEEVRGSPEMGSSKRRVTTLVILGTTDRSM